MKLNSYRDRARVLLLEDNRVLASSLVDILTEMDFVIIGPVSSNEDAFALLNDGGTTIDVGILDIHLGKDSSFATADEFERLSIPYIFCSGQARAEIDDRYGHRTCLLKPFGASALEAAISAALSETPPLG